MDGWRTTLNISTNTLLSGQIPDNITYANQELANFLNIILSFEHASVILLYLVIFGKTGSII